MVQETSKKFIVFGLIILLLALSFFVVWPVLLSVIAGLILSYIFYPVYKFVLRIVKERNISALIVVLLFLFIIFLPVWFLFPIVARQIFDAYAYSQKIDLIGSLRNILPQELSKDMLSILGNFTSNSVNIIFSKLSNIILDLTNILLQFVVVIFIFFFGMRDAEKLKEHVKGISPFSPAVEKNISTRFKDITNSVIFGHIVVGIIQGILTGVGLFIAGVPNALLLTVLATFAAVLPVIGAWLVWIPVSIYLLASGHSTAGIFLILYGGIFISWIDNILKPYIISRKSNISSAVVFIGMIGGLIVFGVMGLILGPLILAYLIVLFDAYKNKSLTEFFSK